MGKSRGLYKEEFPAGSRVRIRDREQLEQFVKEWEQHNPLQKEQLGFAGQTAQVKSVSFYHGGDELYELKDVPGLWHEQCLTNAAN
jgi:hypothetical protein